jgi:acetylornithine deacetylase
VPAYLEKNMNISKNILKWMDNKKSEIVNFASDLIKTPSINPPGDEREVISILKQQLDKLNLKDYEIFAKDPKRPNLILEIPFGSQGPTLMYNGHTDTKPPGDLKQWKTDPLVPTIKKGYLYGLGAVDMKSAVAAMVYSASALKELTKYLNGKLILTFVADEEAGGTFGAKYLSENNILDADIALIGEPTGITEDWEYLYLVSRGETCFVTTVYGTQMHSSISDILPSKNANHLASEIMLKMREHLEINYKPHPLCRKGITVTVGILMKGGVFYGILPGQAEFSTEIRVIPGMSKKDIQRDIDAFFSQLKQENNGIKVEWRFEKPPLDWINPVEVSQNHPFVKSVEDSVKQVLPKVPPRGAFPAWTDARFLSDIAGIPTIPSFGPGLLTQAHKPNERISVKSIIEAAKIYALSAAKYLKNMD